MKTLLLTLLVAGLFSGSTIAMAGADGAAGAKDAAKIDTIADLSRGARMALFGAQQAIERVNLDEAAKTIADYLEKHPDDDHFLLRFHLGNTLLRMEREQAALEEYRRAVALEPRHEDSWLNRGQVAFSLELYAEAADALLMAFELEGSSRSEVLYYVAAAQILGGDPAAAIPHLEALTSGRFGEPRYEWFRTLVSACVSASDPVSGERAVKALLAQFADDPQAWELAFQYGASVGNYRHAAVAMTVVGYLRPLTRAESMQLGDLCQAIGVPLVATSRYTEAIGDSASSDEIERLASAYIAGWDLDSARRVLETACAERPSYRLLSLLGDLHFMQRRFDLAFDAFTRCTELAPDEGRPYLMRGYCAMELERWDESLVDLTRASDYDAFADRAHSLIRQVSRRMAVSS